MAKTKQTEEDYMEAYAKNWQVEALKERVDQQDKMNTRIEGKLDQILINQTTPVQLEERLTSIGKTYDERLATQVEKIQLKYDPLVDTIKWITRLLIGLLLAQGILLVFNLITSQ